jgi:hypothetical protein
MATVTHNKMTLLAHATTIHCYEQPWQLRVDQKLALADQSALCGLSKRSSSTRETQLKQASDARAKHDSECIHVRQDGWTSLFCLLVAAAPWRFRCQLRSTDPPLESTIHEKMSCVDICIDDCTIYVVGAIGQSNDRVGLYGHRLIRNINTVRYMDSVNSINPSIRISYLCFHNEMQPEQSGE